MKYNLYDLVMIHGNRFVPDGTVGRIEYVGSSSLWVNVESANGALTTWAVAPEEVRKVEEEELPVLEYLKARGDKVSEATRNELVEELMEENRKLSGIVTRMITYGVCPEGNYGFAVYVDVNGKADTVFIPKGRFDRLKDEGELWKYEKITEWRV